MTSTSRASFGSEIVRMNNPGFNVTRTEFDTSRGLDTANSSTLRRNAGPDLKWVFRTFGATRRQLSNKTDLIVNVLS